MSEVEQQTPVQPETPQVTPENIESVSTAPETPVNAEEKAPENSAQKVSIEEVKIDKKKTGSLPFVNLKSPTGKEIKLALGLDGKFTVEYGGEANADEAAQAFFTLVQDKFQREFDILLKNYQDLSYVGAKKVAGKNYAVRVTKDGDITYNNMNTEEFVKSLSSEQKEELVKSQLNFIQ